MTARMRGVCAALVGVLAASAAISETDFLVAHKLSNAPKLITAPASVVDAAISQNCTLGKAQYLLLPGEFASGNDPRDGVPGRYVCFKAKCDMKPETPLVLDTQVTMFVATAKKTTLICAPEGPACPGGAQVGGYCWYLGGDGLSCDQTCANVGKTYSTATQTYAGSAGTDANCNAVLDWLQVPAPSLAVAGYCSYALYIPLPVECAWVPSTESRLHCTNTPPEPTFGFPVVQRACACE